MLVRMAGFVDYARATSCLTRGAMAGLALATGAVLVLDFTTDVWSDRPMLTALLSGAFLIAFTAVLVNAYLSFAAMQRWLPVAAAALEDLGRVSRAVWIQLIRDLHLANIQGRTRDITAWLMDAGGRQALDTGVKRVAENSEERKKLFEELNKLARSTKDLIAQWGPIMLPQPDAVRYLARFAEMHRRMAGLLAALQVEQASGELEITTDELAEELLWIVEEALRQDGALFERAVEFAPIAAIDEIVRAP